MAVRVADWRRSLRQKAYNDDLQQQYRLQLRLWLSNKSHFQPALELNRQSLNCCHASKSLPYQKLMFATPQVVRRDPDADRVCAVLCREWRELAVISIASLFIPYWSLLHDL